MHLQPMLSHGSEWKLSSHTYSNCSSWTNSNIVSMCGHLYYIWTLYITSYSVRLTPAPGQCSISLGTFKLNAPCQYINEKRACTIGCCAYIIYHKSWTTMNICAWVTRDEDCYRIAHNSRYFSRGVILVFFTVEWNPWKSRKFMTRIHVHVVLQSSFHETRHCYNSHPAKTVTKLQGPSLFLGLACCCLCT